MQKIIHVDMDCFFAAIEMRDNPELRHVPLAVGGEAGGRGVLCTANYQARKFGVRSAMPTAQALKLCPQLVLVKPHGSKYKEASDHIKEIFQRYTDKIEPLSLDEAYLDVSVTEHFHGSAQLIAKDIKKAIQKELKLTASAGVSCNKFVAKVASDWNKPNGLFVVTPDKVDEFVCQLNVAKIPGVGKVTAQKLAAHGILTCRDLRQWPLSNLKLLFGKFGQVLYERARGIDNRSVQTSHIRKSLSVERTFWEDIAFENVEEQLFRLEEEFTYRLEKLKARGDFPIKQLFAKVKFSDFQISTCEEKKDETFLEALNKDFLISPEVHQFLLKLTQQSFQRSDKKIRLLGIGARFYSAPERSINQLELVFPL